MRRLFRLPRISVVPGISGSKFISTVVVSTIVVVLLSLIGVVTGG